MSCANDDEEANVSPATTARIVANATDAMKASMSVPPSSPKTRVPISRASCGAAVLPALFCSRIASLPTSAAAPKPSAIVIR